MLVNPLQNLHQQVHLNLLLHQQARVQAKVHQHQLVNQLQLRLVNQQVLLHLSQHQLLLQKVLQQAHH